MSSLPHPRTRPLVRLAQHYLHWHVLIGGHEHGGAHHIDPDCPEIAYREAVLHHARCANWTDEMYDAWMEQRKSFPTWDEVRAA